RSSLPLCAARPARSAGRYCAWLRSSVRGSSGDPGVVAPLQSLEQLDEQLGAIELPAGFDEQRGRGHVHLLRQLLLWNVDVDPDSEHDPAFARLGQNAGDLPPAQQQVIRE